jgi:hypothetical protein
MQVHGAALARVVRAAPSGGVAMNRYPVFFAVTRPERFDRVQIALRVALLVVLSFVGVTMGVLFALLYLGLPLIAAILLSQRGPSRFLAEGAPRLAAALRWIMGAYAYMALLTDRLPGDPESGVRFAVEPGAWSTPAGGGGPTVGTALLRVIYSLPSALVLGVLGIVSWIVWIVAAIAILIGETYPEGLHDFQCGVLRWQARLLAYHASLVEPYPPFSLDTGTYPRADRTAITH